MTDQIWDEACTEAELKSLDNYFKQRLAEILPERKKFFSERYGFKEPENYGRGFDDCLAEIRKQAGI